MHRLPTIPILEWSPQGCRLIDPATRSVIGGQSAEEALEKGGKPRQVVLALARRQSFERTVRLPDVPKAEALSILRFQLDDLFPVETQDLAYDLEFTDQTDSEGRLAVVYATKAETIRQARRDVEMAGAKVVRAIPASLGAAALAHQAHLDTAIVIDRSPEGVTFDVVQHGQTVLSRTTTDELGATQLNAEVARTLASAELVTATVLSNEEWPLSPPPTIVGTSSTVALLDADTTVDFQLPEDKLAADNKVVLGRRNLAALLFAAAFCMGALFYMDRDDANQRIEKEKKKWAFDTNSITKRNEELSSKLTALEAKANLVENGSSPKQYASDLVAEVSNAVTDGVWLNGISYERGRPLIIRGIAKNQAQVAAYVDVLSSQDRLRDVTLTFANASKIEDTDVVQFSVSAHVIGNYPLDDPSKSSVAKR